MGRDFHGPRPLASLPLAPASGGASWENLRLWVPQALGTRLSPACSLVQAALHLWESPGYYPSVGRWLDLALSADPRMVPWEGAVGRDDKTRAREAGRVGEEKGRSQLRFISKHTVFSRIKARIRSYLLPGGPEGAFHGKCDQLRSFQSYQGEI